MTNTTNGKVKVLYCNCSNSSIIPEALKQDVQSALIKSGTDICAVPDLCGMAARRDPRLMHIAAAENLTIIACYPRAVRWLFFSAGLTLSETVNILNMRTQTVEQINSALPRGTGQRETGDASLSFMPETMDDSGEEPWIPWFPVIDYSRCKDCKQCASFCLFGTYDMVNDKVTVTNPSHCKNNCPACARICPEAAIIFPKLAESPINGDEVRNEEEVRALIKLNTEVMLGSDIYAALAERRKKAKQMLLKKKDGARSGASAQAYMERQKHLDNEKHL